MNDEHLKTLKATTWEELNPDWIEDGDLTDRFAKSQFDTCPSCDSIENIRVVNSSGDDEMASVLCCNWQCNGDCPSEAIENWNRRAAISAIERNNEMRELLEAAVTIGFQNDFLTRISPETWVRHSDDEATNGVQFNSALDAFAEVKKEQI